MKTLGLAIAALAIFALLVASAVCRTESTGKAAAAERQTESAEGAVAAERQTESPGQAVADAMVSLGAKTIAPPSPVWVIGSYDSTGRANMMTAAWVGVCCSKPPCVMIALRAATYSHGNITAAKAFTVNIPSERFAREAAYFGTVSGRDVDKLAATGLTAVRSSLVNAPYLAAFPLILECEVIRTVELGLHTMFIGEIKDVKASAAVLNEKGTPDFEKIDPFVFGYGSGGFYGTGGFIGRTSELAEEIKERRTD